MRHSQRYRVVCSTEGIGRGIVRLARPILKAEETRPATFLTWSLVLRLVRWVSTVASSMRNGRAIDPKNNAVQRVNSARQHDDDDGDRTGAPKSVLPTNNRIVRRW